MLNLNVKAPDSLDNSCKDNVHSLLVENEAHTLSVSNDIEINMNHVDQIMSLQNACPILRAAHFGFTKLGVSSQYRLADFSYKLHASSFEEWTL